MAASIGTKLAVSAALLVLLLQAPPCAVAARRHQEQPRAAAAVSSSKIEGMPAVMTLNSFKRGGDGGDPAECDGQYHNDGDPLAALSTGWYEHGNRCQRMIRITSVDSGDSVLARVVDECDSGRGCRTNIVDTSRAVWEALGLDTKVGEVAVTWSDA
ncbi:hypothetical protein ACP4OV_010992 [Aristida adscensionis]